MNILGTFLLKESSSGNKVETVATLLIHGDAKKNEQRRAKRPKTADNQLQVNTALVTPEISWENKTEMQIYSPVHYQIMFLRFRTAAMNLTSVENPAASPLYHPAMKTATTKDRKSERAQVKAMDISLTESHIEAQERTGQSTR